MRSRFRSWKKLSDRVVVTVAAPAHAADEAMCFQEILPVVPRELRALIGAVHVKLLVASVMQPTAVYEWRSNALR